MLSLCKTKKCCNELISKLNSDSLTLEVGESIRYVCGLNTNTYRKIQQQIKSIDEVVKLGLLPLVAFYLNITVPDLNANPALLYDNLHYKVKEDIAINLRHLEGMKYLSKNDSISFFTEYCKSVDHLTCLDHVAMSNDASSWSYFLNKNNSLTNSELMLLINKAYRYGSFDIAFDIIKNLNITFSNKFTISMYADFEKDKYIEHITSLKKHSLLSDETLRDVHLLINATVSQIHFGGIELLYSTDANVSKVLNSTIYNEVTRTIFGVMFALRFPNTILASIESLSPLYSPSNKYYKAFSVDTKDPSFSKKFIHELTHAVIDAVFENNALPYPKVTGDKHFQAYQNARHQFLSNVCNELKIKCTNNNYESDLAKDEYFYLNEYCIARYNKKTSSNSSFELLTRYGTDMISQSLTGSKVFNKIKIELDKQKLVKLIEIERNGLHNNESFRITQRELNATEAETINILKSYKILKEGFQLELSLYCDSYKIDEDAIFRSRIFDYVKRNKKEWDTELLPRLAEFYVDSERNPSIEKLFEPLFQYWEGYITPKADELIRMHHNIENPNPFIKEETTWYIRLLDLFGQDYSYSTIGEALNHNITQELQFFDT